MTILLKTMITVATVLLLNGTGACEPRIEEFIIVTAEKVNVQAEPGKQEFLQKTLNRGTEVKLIKRLPGWLQILNNGEVGFIRDQADLVKIVQRKKAAAEPHASKQPDDLEERIDTYKKRVETLSREIEKSKEEVEAYNRRETDVIKRLNDAELALNKSRKRAAVLKADLNALDIKIAETSHEAEELRKQVRTNEDYVAKRLVALYKMNQLGIFHLLASAESIHEFIQRKAALTRILAYDEKTRRDLINNQIELGNVLARLQAHKAEKNERAAEYKKQIDIMSQELSARTNLLEEIRSQKSLELAAIEALTQSAAELDQKITSLSTTVESVSPDKSASQLPFSTHKGLLIMPVKGKIVSLFGPYKNAKYNVTNFRSGIDIKADKGEPVRSVFKGKVLYCDWFKGYGNMMIIDHGNNYYTVYAHLEETFKSKGDAVDTAEVIATVGDTAAMTEVKLYFEVRYHGTPLDPLDWLKTG